MKSIDDTSNFDDFPDVQLKIPCAPKDDATGAVGAAGGAAAGGAAAAQNYKDWVFINYTFKRFEGLTQRGNKKLMTAFSAAPTSGSGSTSS